MTVTFGASNLCSFVTQIKIEGSPELDFSKSAPVCSITLLRINVDLKTGKDTYISGGYVQRDENEFRAITSPSHVDISKLEYPARG